MFSDRLKEAIDGGAILENEFQTHNRLMEMELLPDNQDLLKNLLEYAMGKFFGHSIELDFEFDSQNAERKI